MPEPTTSPASMGGPLSEAGRARRLAEIRAHFEAANVDVPLDAPMKERTARVSAGIGLMTNGREYTEFLLNLVGVLEGQLATARERHQPVIGGIQIGRSIKQVKVCSSCPATQWPCEDAVALGLDGGDPDA